MEGVHVHRGRIFSSWLCITCGFLLGLQVNLYARLVVFHLARVQKAAKNVQLRRASASDVHISRIDRKLSDTGRIIRRGGVSGMCLGSARWVSSSSSSRKKSTPEETVPGGLRLSHPHLPSPFPSPHPLHPLRLPISNPILPPITHPSFACNATTSTKMETSA